MYRKRLSFLFNFVWFSISNTEPWQVLLFATDLTLQICNHIIIFYYSSKVGERKLLMTIISLFVFFPLSQTVSSTNKLHKTIAQVLEKVNYFVIYWFILLKPFSISMKELKNTMVFITFYIYVLPIIWTQNKMA